MNLLDSLLDALVRLDGDALVMHVGEKPYVVTTSEAASQFRGPLAWGQVELSSRVLTLDAVNGMLEQILPADQRTALDEFGAIEHAVTSATDATQRFTIVAAKGGDDIWVEVRRHPKESPEVIAEPTQLPASELERDDEIQPDSAVAPSEPEKPLAAAGRDFAAPEHDVRAGHEPAVTVPAEDEQLPEHEVAAEDATVAEDIDWGDDVMTEGDLGALLRISNLQETAGGGPAVNQPQQNERRPPVSANVGGSPDIEEGEDIEISLDEALRAATAETTDDRSGPTAAGGDSGQAAAADGTPATESGRARPAIVVPLNRPGRPETPVDVRAGVTIIERFLRMAASRAASAVYLVPQTAPTVRAQGEFTPLEGEPAFSAALIEKITEEMSPRGRDDAGRVPSEWTMDVTDVGRVRCTAFRDHHGPGLIFRMIPQRSISADQLALAAEIQALCGEADGLVLVAGGRGSGKSTLLTSFVDLINRTRSEHVITVESQIEFVHENRRSFISQREVRGDPDAVVTAVRTASREDPDVLVLEDLRAPELVTLALETAQSGRLVLASMPSPSALSAIERILEMFPPDRREKTQTMLAATLRGVVSQVLLRKLKGGLIAAREVLLNTPAVANLIAEGKTYRLAGALDSGRRQGMTSLAESLAALVREGIVHPSHAYRKAPNREQFLALLRRDGIDTSVAERLG